MDDQTKRVVKKGLYELGNASTFVAHAKGNFKTAGHQVFHERAKSIEEQVENLIRDVCAETGELYVTDTDRPE